MVPGRGCLNPCGKGNTWPVVAVLNVTETTVSTTHTLNRPDLSAIEKF